jgi:hypothetical protein
MKALYLLLTILLFTCPVKQIQAQQKPPITISPEEKSKKIVELKLGEASGVFKAKGETVQLRYAYARWVKHVFTENEKMVDLLLTEKAIPKEKLASVFAHSVYGVYPSYEWLGGSLRGMRFQIQKDGHTVLYGATHVDLSVGGGNGLDELKLVGDRISGTAQEKHFGIDRTPWSYSLSFVASISKSVQ